MHLFNVKRLFARRRKYDRMVGGQQEGSLDRVGSHVDKINGQHDHLNTQAQEMSSKSPNFYGSAASTSSSSSSVLRGFKLRPKLRMQRQKSKNLASTTVGAPLASRAAVQNFLQGPTEAKEEEEVYRQQCKDLLRKLSARGNRVPGFI